MRGSAVVRLADLVNTYDSVAVEAGSVLQKFAQWQEVKPKRNQTKRRRSSVEEVHRLNGGEQNGSRSVGAVAI